MWQDGYYSPPSGVSFWQLLSSLFLAGGMPFSSVKNSVWLCACCEDKFIKMLILQHMISFFRSSQQQFVTSVLLRGASWQHFSHPSNESLSVLGWWPPRTPSSHQPNFHQFALSGVVSSMIAGSIWKENKWKHKLAGIEWVGEVDGAWVGCSCELEEGFWKKGTMIENGTIVDRQRWWWWCKVKC